MKTMHLLSPALLVGVLLGCASPRFIPMTEGAASKIKSTEAILVLSQQEIAAEINPSAVAAATGGGLLFALVDVAVNKSRADDAEAAIAPIKNALLDYDFATGHQENRRRGGGERRRRRAGHKDDLFADTRFLVDQG